MPCNRAYTNITPADLAEGNTRSQVCGKIMDLSSLQLPGTLGNMITYLIKTYGHIKSWNVYDNNKGTMNINIRFDTDIVVVPGEAAMPIPVAYRRLSRKQMDHNRDRASKQADTHKKRKLADSPPEILRKDSTKLPHSRYSCVDTPETVIPCDTMCDSSTTLRRSTSVPDVKMQY